MLPVSQAQERGKVIEDVVDVLDLEVCGTIKRHDQVAQTLAIGAGPRFEPPGKRLPGPRRQHTGRAPSRAGSNSRLTDAPPYLRAPKVEEDIYVAA
jgi:hypothetical protein